MMSFGLFVLKVFISVRGECVQINSYKAGVFAVTNAASKSVASGQTHLCAERGTLRPKHWRQNWNKNKLEENRQSCGFTLIKMVSYIRLTN